ncbi:MAG: hypothetical protein IKA32_05050 [Lentisphaeria bacterium]|nr:hypothetical protein [Lentisphaeria bacterium]
MLKIIYSSLTAGGCGAVAALLICFLMRHVYRRDEEQRKVNLETLAKAKEKRLTDLEQKVDRHIANDKSLEILTEMRHVNGNLEKLTTQVTRALETNARQSSEIENNKNFINNLRDDMANHVRIFHGGKR